MLDKKPCKRMHKTGAIATNFKIIAIGTLAARPAGARLNATVRLE